MRRRFTPFPEAQHQVVVSVDVGDEGKSMVVLSEESGFGHTSMTFNPETARQVAATLLRAAEAAELGTNKPEKQERKSVPKLAAVR